MRSIIEHKGMRVVIEDILPTQDNSMILPDLMILIDQAICGYGYQPDTGELGYWNFDEMGDLTDEEEGNEKDYPM